MAFDDCLIVRKRYLPHQPFAPADPNQIAIRTLRDQVGAEYRLDQFLHPRTLADQLGSPSNLPSKHRGLRARYSDIRQEVRGVKLSEDSCVDPVSLNLPVGHHMHLLGIGYQDPI